MHLKKSFLFSKGALAESISAILMLLIIFAVMTGILAVYTTYNVNTQDQLKIDQAKSQEKIMISDIQVDDQTKITSVTVNNTGSIEVKIRALYVSNNGMVTFLDLSAPDPSSHMSTYIATGKSLTIPLISGQLFDPQSKIIAATERGTKTIEDEYSLVVGEENPPQGFDADTLYAGPLSLQFTAFYYQATQHWPNPSGTWNLGGSIPRGTTCVWKLTITNIGNRSITLYRTSSFTTVSSGSTNTLTWFIDTPNIELPVDTPTDITFVWSDADKHTKLVSMYPQSNVNCMIFLTFFGYYHDDNNTPYAQTIPFEATRTT